MRGKKHSKGRSRPDSATFEPLSSARLTETAAFLMTGGSPQAFKTLVAARPSPGDKKNGMK